MDLAEVLSHFKHTQDNEPVPPLAIDAPLDGRFFPHYWHDLVPKKEVKPDAHLPHD